MNFKRHCIVFEDKYRNAILDAFVHAVFNPKDTIIGYEEDELYDLLMKSGVSISAINQILRLRTFGYALKISDAVNLSTDELRNLVKECSAK